MFVYVKKVFLFLFFFTRDKQICLLICRFSGFCQLKLLMHLFECYFLNFLNVNLCLICVTHVFILIVIILDKSICIVVLLVYFCEWQLLKLPVCTRICEYLLIGTFRDTYFTCIYINIAQFFTFKYLMYVYIVGTKPCAMFPNWS